MTGRVIHVLRKYDPDEWGGTETHVVEVTKRLARRGWEVEVHAPAGPSAPDHGLDPAVRLVRYRAFLPVVGPRDRRRALVSNAGNLISLDEPLRLVRDRRATLAHLHTGGRVGGAVRTAMRLTGRPYLVSVHGPFLASRDWLERDTRARLSRVLDVGQPAGLLFGSRRVVDDAARVISFNEEEREAIASRVNGRSIRMDHGVDVQRLAAGDAARARGRWPELATGPVVTVVGRLARQKNQVLAVQAFAAGAPPDHRLALAGANTDLGYREEVERAARELGVADRVHFLGNLSASTEVPDLYALSRVLLVPSTHEAFGLIVLEGWGAGCPVLFPRHSGLADIADALGHEAAVVPSLDSGDWIERLRVLTTDAEARRANVRAGDALIRRRYDWDRVVDRLEEIYAEVLSR